MQIENNSPSNLRTLYIQGKISYNAYMFRLKANEINVNTHQIIK